MSLTKRIADKLLITEDLANHDRIVAGETIEAVTVSAKNLKTGEDAPEILEDDATIDEETVSVMAIDGDNNTDYEVVFLVEFSDGAKDSIARKLKVFEG